MTRISTAALLSIALLAAAGCENKDSTTTTTTDKTKTTTPAKTPRTDTNQPDPMKKADNTGQNKMDRDNTTITPMDQSNATEDIKLSADIRKAILDDSTLSVNAKNCKIVTDKSGVVTLRGVVDTQAEKDSVEAKAKAIAGVTRVDNQLEVKNP